MNGKSKANVRTGIPVTGRNRPLTGGNLNGVGKGKGGKADVR